jgi:hypothetical protein
MSAPSDRIPAPACGASSIAATGGPTAVPFRLCCAHSIIRSGADGPAAVQCAVAGGGASETPSGPTAARTAP